MSVATLYALGGGALSALLYVSSLVGSVGALLLVLMTQLPLFLVGLSRGQGSRGALAAAGTGLVLVALIAGFWAAGNYLLAEAVPACLLVRQATLSRSHPDGTTEWYPPGPLVLWMSLYAGLVFLAFMIYFAGREGGLEGELQRSFAVMREALGVESPPPAAQRLLDMLIAIMPGLAASSWLLITAGNAGLAQGLLVRAERNLRPSPALASFALPSWLAGAVALSAAGGLFLSGPVGFASKNLCLVLAMPYFFGGLALTHAFARASGAGTGLLMLLYTLLGIFILILSWLAILGLAALGFIDQVAGLRARLVRPKNGSNGSRE
jgi:hypothetical protein